MTTGRTQRLNEIFLREFNTLLRQRFQSEALFLSVSRVEVAPDLRTARVYYSAPTTEQKLAAKAFFQRHVGEIRRLLAQRIPIKFFPDFYFAWDSQLQNELRVNEILDSLEEDSIDHSK